jgi:hypothetical protein
MTKITIQNDIITIEVKREGLDESNPLKDEIKANQQVAKDPLWDLTSPK